MSQRVLILCTGNSARSQMAEGIWNTEAGQSWLASSAGSNPAGYVHPLAVRAMKEVGIDISQAESKHVDQFLDERLDLVVTVCDNAAQNCPALPGSQTLHWPFDDPAAVRGSEEEQLSAFRHIRDLIRERIQRYLQQKE